MRRGFTSEFNNCSGIYVIRSLSEQTRVYVGSATQFRKRYNGHLRELKAGIHRNSKLQRYASKYGIESLEFVILECCEKQYLLEREQHYIDVLVPFFNTCKEAGNTMGRICSEPTKAKISQSNLGKPRNMPDGWRETVSLMLQQRNISDDMREKVRAAKSIPVAQYDLNGKFIQVFPSSKDAATATTLGRGDIHACCKGIKGKRKLIRVGNFQWRFYQGDKSDIAPYKRYGSTATGICKRGHLMTEENKYINPKGHLHCRACVQISTQKYLIKKRHSIPEDADQ